MKFALCYFRNTNSYFLYYRNNNIHRWSGYFRDIQSCFKVPLKNYHNDMAGRYHETFESYVNYLTCYCDVIVFETNDILTALDKYPELLI